MTDKSKPAKNRVKEHRERKNMTQAQLESSKPFNDTAGTYRAMEGTQKVAVPEQH